MSRRPGERELDERHRAVGDDERGRRDRRRVLRDDRQCDIHPAVGHDRTLRRPRRWRRQEQRGSGRRRPGDRRIDRDEGRDRLKGRGDIGALVALRPAGATLNLGAQGQFSLESWDLGSGDSVAVNVATLNALVSHPLVTLPIRGGSTSLGLTFNSEDPGADIGVGAGWRLNVQRRLTLNVDGTVTFIDADGARYRFSAPVTNGTVTTYTRPAALMATLVKDTSITADEFVLIYRDQSRDKFDILGSEAILVRTEDRFANGLSVAYAAGTTRITRSPTPPGGGRSRSPGTARTPT